jgi:hypothetical protein
MTGREGGGMDWSLGCWRTGRHLATIVGQDEVIFRLAGVQGDE